MADGNRTAAGPLRGRIPAIGASQLQPLREFFQRHQHWLLPDNGTLRFAPGHPAAADEVFELDADGSRLGLRLQAPPPAGDMPHWSDYRGRARVLAWSLAHERWLMRLSEAFGVALTPLLDGPPPDAPPEVWLDFLVEDDDPEAKTPGAALLQGSLRAPAQWLPRLLAQAAPPYADEPPTPLGRWRELPVRLRLLLDVPPRPAGDWSALRPGDVLVIGPRAAPLQLQARGAGRAWPLAATAQGWRVEGAAQPLPSPLSRVGETGPMSEHETAATAAPEDPDAGMRPLPVRLSFEVGALDLRVGELAELQPGYVFALPAHLEGANVVLRANGEAVGQGELVAVGDTLGVRLIAWT